MESASLLPDFTISNSDGVVQAIHALFTFLVCGGAPFSTKCIAVGGLLVVIQTGIAHRACQIRRLSLLPYSSRYDLMTCSHTKVVSRSLMRLVP